RVAQAPHRAREPSPHRVVAQQVGDELRAGRVVDGHHLHLGAAQVDGAPQVAADASDTVDPQPHRPSSAVAGASKELMVRRVTVRYTLCLRPAGRRPPAGCGNVSLWSAIPGTPSPTWRTCSRSGTRRSGPNRGTGWGWSW